MILWDLSIPPPKRVAFHTTVLPKSVRIFYNKCTFNKTLSQLKSGKWIGQVHYPRRNGTRQFPVWMTQKPRKAKIQKKFPGEHTPGPLSACLGNWSVFILDPRLRTISFVLLEKNWVINGVEALAKWRWDNIWLNIFVLVLTGKTEKTDNICVVQERFRKKPCRSEHLNSLTWLY